MEIHEDDGIYLASQFVTI